MGLAAAGWQVWWALPVMALWGLSGPAVQSLMTAHVRPSEQGQLQGANASLTGISELVGPNLFGLTLAYVLRPGMPAEAAGAPFLLAAAILLAATVTGVWSTWHEPPEADRDL